MLKILKSEQIREIDKYTIKYGPVKSIDLMEQTAKQILEKITQLFLPQESFCLFAGAGNNGGDVIALYRLMLKKNISAQLFITNPSEQFSPDNRENIRILEQMHIPYNYWKTTDNFQLLNKNHIIIDGIFGSGLSRPVEGFYAALINFLNTLPNKKIAIDIPSGLFGEDNRQNNGAIICADITLSIQFPKLSFFYFENEKYIGNWHIININLLPEAISNAQTTNFFTEICDIKKTIRLRKRFSHKGNFGHALIISGNDGKYGAMTLAAKACLRSGAGLVSVCSKAKAAQIVHCSIPEAMFIPIKHIDLNPFSSVGIGPGLGTEKEIFDIFDYIISNIKTPIVIDADAINMISAHREMLLKIPKKSILTPHIGEFDRFAGKSSSSLERLTKAKKIAETYKIILVLKGANTAIIDTCGNCYFNPTGNQGMATGGSGDVLTGLITGILASGYEPLEAATIGVYIHGLAGDIALKTQSYESLIASDIINHIGDAFIELK